MKKILFLIFALSCLANSCRNPQNGNAADNTSSEASYVESLGLGLQGWYDTGYFPGFAVSVFSQDSIFYQKGFCLPMFP